MFTICRQLAHTVVNSFVEQVIVKNENWLDGTTEMLQGSYVYVCCLAMLQKISDVGLMDLLLLQGSNMR